MKKRLTALLLVLVMVIGIMPLGVFAGSVDDFLSAAKEAVITNSGTAAWETKTYDGEEVLFSGVKTGSTGNSVLTIKMTEDATLSFDYKVSSYMMDKFTVKLKSDDLSE